MVVLLTFLCQPMIILAGQDEKNALLSYFSGNLSHLNTLLASDFQYRYFNGGKLIIINREEERRALARLLKDTVGNTIGHVQRIEEDIKHSGRFGVKLHIDFEDSPKIYTDSFFRGDTLIIDQVFDVTLDKDKIKQISEVKEKSSADNLLFGNLKKIYLKNVTNEWDEKAGEDRLYDKASHELILWKKLKTGEATEWFYYWSSNRLIGNFWYSERPSN